MISTPTDAWRVSTCPTLGKFCTIVLGPAVLRSIQAALIFFVLPFGVGWGLLLRGFGTCRRLPLLPMLLLMALPCIPPATVTSSCWPSWWMPASEEVQDLAAGFPR